MTKFDKNVLEAKYVSALTFEETKDRETEDNEHHPRES